MKKWFYFLFSMIFIISIQSTSANNEKVIYFYNWTEYVPPGLLEQFTKETGIKVIYSTYESNESMYAKLKTLKNNSYDLIVPSTYFISKMRKEGMLIKIDKSQLSNFKYLDNRLLNKSFDPNNLYSIPYIWGVTTIAINNKAMNASDISSWADLWSAKYKKSLLLIDDAREVFQIALKKLGFSGNTRDSEQIKAAYNELKKLIPNVLAFNADNPGNPYIEREVNVGMIWNGSAYVAQQSGLPLQLIWPKEGAILWMDNLAIPNNAKNISGSLKLINFLLRPDIAAQVAQSTGYTSPNLEAKKLLPKNISSNPYLYPSEEVIKKAEWQDDVGDASVQYETLFQKLKTEM
ncbi:extracellular solute-binding protein [Candidatus Ishikawella capsulata]|uniref:Putrescine-binding periplasmic protein n=1 Tax=Candidatus Ishikawaella capsulata Mpkobe TaxID=476281 RepID=C5WD09_9ENTR|nr:extracellular solute-binding protein [Candidatus Ishikawaella capsulata]BAH83215.1 spermidine/putrescine ABC transporter periplasmic substrate-binding protein [Candidatus Ishikawaella capsulata Mpkobe]